MLFRVYCFKILSNRLDNILQTPITSPKLFDAQASLREQVHPLKLRPFHASKAHHVDVLQGHMSMGTNFWHHGVSDQDVRAGAHGLDCVSKNHT